MKVSGIVAAFAYYGATLRNQMWAVSALTEDAVVLSLWQHRFRGMTCHEKMSRWGGPGNALCRAHVQQAFSEGRKVRAVIVSTAETTAIDSGVDGSSVKKTFSVREDWVGRIESFDGEHLRIRFERVSPSTQA